MRRSYRGLVVGSLAAAAFVGWGARGPVEAARPGPKAPRLAVAWNDVDRQVGLFNSLVPQPFWNFVGRPQVVGADTGFRSADGKLFVLGRSHGTVTRVNPQGGRRVYTLGRANPPDDLAVYKKRYAYISRPNATRLLRLDLRNGRLKEVVDLSSFADSDGVPDLGTMALHGDRLFIQIRRLNATSPTGYESPAYLAVVDLRTEQLVDADATLGGVQGIRLTGTSPKHRMQVIPKSGRLLVSATGGFHDKGGLEEIDLANLRSLGLAIREEDGMVGADLGPFVLISRDQGYLVYSTDLDLSSHLKPFSLTWGVDPDPELHVSVGYAVPALEHDPRTDTLFVPDGTFDSQGVLVFQASTGERLAPRPIPSSGPPTDLMMFP